MPCPLDSLLTHDRQNDLNEYTSNIDLDQAAAFLREAQGRIAVLTHTKPDGDAGGSVVALVSALRAMGKDAVGLLVPPILPGLSPMVSVPGVQVVDDVAQIPAAQHYVIVDTGAWSQVGPLRELIEEHLDHTTIFDHHLAGDIPAARRYIDSKSAAAAEIIADLVEMLVDVPALDKEVGKIINEALFTGISSDTGWFRFSNVTPRTHTLAARLIDRGVDHANLFGRLEQSERPEKLALLIRAVGSLQLLADGKAAIMTLRVADFDETGALPEETERLIDIPQAVSSIQAIALITEVHHGEGIQTRISFRSKPLANAVNVSQLAEQFGGGGHARAAGAKLDAPVDEVVQRVVEALTAAVNGATHTA